MTVVVTAFTALALLSTACTPSTDGSPSSAAAAPGASSGATSTSSASAAPFTGALTSVASIVPSPQSPQSPRVTSISPTIPAAGVGPTQPAPVGQLPAAAQAVISKPAYQGARWGYRVQDAATRKVLLSYQPQQMFFTASTAKLITVGSSYAALGADSTFTTPVYTTAAPVGGVLDGNVVLVASGDLAMGGRGAMDGRIDQAFTRTAIDHIYGDLAPNAAFVKDDPLAGLDALARQVAAKGIKRVDGNVAIDTRVWETYKGREGPVPSIFINDNILDLTVTAGATAGSTASIGMRPQTKAFAVRSTVTTDAKGGRTTLEVTPSPTDARTLVVTGTIAAGTSQLKIYRIPDAASWARTLLVEALQRAGVSVSAPSLAANDEKSLPAPKSYPAVRKVASITSPPLHEYGTMVLETSYNTGANALMCVLAAHVGSTDCEKGLDSIRKQVDRAGLSADQVILVDGQGADPASASADQMAKWLEWTQTQSWGTVFYDGQPTVGETGTLASVGYDSPAKGKIHSKTGTSAAGDSATVRVLYNVQTISGFMTAQSGQKLIFTVWMSGGVYPDLPTALSQSNEDVTDVAIAFQQAL